MGRLPSTLAVLAAVWLWTIAPAAAAPDAGMGVGAAVVDITPEDGETLDPLHARALVWRQGKETAALVLCDLISVSYELTDPVRRRAAEKTGIPFEHICIAATHTHNGRGSCKGLEERLVQAIADAASAATPVRLETGTAQQAETISFNRRFLMTDGTVRFNPGPLNPDIVRPVGPIDPEVGIVMMRRADNGRPMAALVNFALHCCTVGRSGWSADYPCFLERSLQDALGGDFLCAFGAGACGDVNHFDVSRPRLGATQHQGQTFLTPYEPVKTTKSPSPLTFEYIGRALAATVKEALPKLRKVESPALAVRREVIRAPLATYSEMDLAWAKEAVRKDTSFLMRIRANRILALDELRRDSDTIPVEVQAFRFSDDTAIVALPGELFVELGLAIKKASPFATTLVIELANDRKICYVPTSKAFVEGDYEVVNSRLAPGGGELMVEAAVRLLQELK